MDHPLEQNWEEKDGVYRDIFELLFVVQMNVTGVSGGKAHPKEIIEYFKKYAGLHWKTKDGYYLSALSYDNGNGYRFDVGSEQAERYEFEYNELIQGPNKIRLTVKEFFIVLATVSIRDNYPHQIIGYKHSDEVRLNVGYKENLYDHHRELSVTELIERETIILEHIRKDLH